MGSEAMKWGLVGAIALAIAPSGLPAQGLPKVRIETTAGAFIVEVDTVHTPVTGANFLHYVDVGLYLGGSFFRTVTLSNQPNDAVKIEVIQGGSDSTKRSSLTKAIPLERTNSTGLRHLGGTISMARAGPDTAQDQFFICVTDQPELDFGGKRNKDGQGFAAFGRVVSGMDVVRRIQQSPADGQRLTPAVTIVRAQRAR